MYEMHVSLACETHELVRQALHAPCAYENFSSHMENMGPITGHTPLVRGGKNPPLKMNKEEKRS